MTTTKKKSSLRHLRDQRGSIGRSVRVEVGRGRNARVEFLWVEPVMCGAEITHWLVQSVEEMADMIRYAGPDGVCPACFTHYREA
jgi:hypothetical protein